MKYKVTRLRQKEFGIFRKMMEKTRDKHINKANLLDSMIHQNITKIERPEIEKELLQDPNITLLSPLLDNLGRKHSAEKSPISKKEYNNIKKVLNTEAQRNEFTDAEIDYMMILMHNYKNNLCEVHWDRSLGLDQLAHEVGHVKNWKGSFLDKMIHKAAIKGSRLRKRENPGIVNAFLSILSNPIIKWEEKNASKKAYESLKQYNLSKEELEIVKKKLDKAIENYKSTSSADWRNKLINSKIPKWLL